MLLTFLSLLILTPNARAVDPPPPSPVPAPAVNEMLPIDESRDPFMRPASSPLSETSDIEIDAIERYPLSDLRLTGLITGGGLIPKGIITAPNGKTFIVSTNSRIGNREGVVRKISSRGILVRERVKNLVNEYDITDVPIPLAEKQKSQFPTSDSPPPIQANPAPEQPLPPGQ